MESEPLNPRGGSCAYLVTHCNEQIVIRNSKNSRAARWLRNKWSVKPCEKCKIPEWKLEKYSETVFRRGRIPAYLLEQRQQAESN